jgi:hypothetical protein
LICLAVPKMWKNTVAGAQTLRPRASELSNQIVRRDRLTGEPEVGFYCLIAGFASQFGTLKHPVTGTGLRLSERMGVQSNAPIHFLWRQARHQCSGVGRKARRHGNKTLG